MRSLATITRSPASFWYSSRTFPVCRCTRPGTSIGSGFSTNPDTVPPRGSVQVPRFSRMRVVGVRSGWSVAFADAVEQVRRGALDAGVHMAGPVQGRGPGEGAGGEHPGAGGGAVEGRLLVAQDAVVVGVGGVGEQDALVVLGQRGAR